MGKKEVIFRLGELFCGPGGLALGAINSRIQKNGIVYKVKHAWATDYDKDTCKTYKRNICKGIGNSVICEDVRKLNFHKLQEISSIDGLAFGFPCNDFSSVGEQKGIDGVFGPLYSYGVKALKFFKPLWFLAENVGGLRNSNDGKAFELVLSELHNTGYNIFPHLYKFEEYGIPQTRHRIIIIGIRKNINLYYSVPSQEKYADDDISSRNALESPPIKKSVANNEYTKQSKTVIERLKFIKPGENAFTADLPDHLKLNVKAAKISQIYKRLEATKPAYTVTGSGGGGTHVYHWSENRALTNRERARLQTFPDTFVFEGSKESVRKQIGMAVPPKIGKILFEAILKTFAEINYNCIDLNIEPRLFKANKESINNSQMTLFSK